ncbi:unnamed protein product [Closterium sp. Naga37s-1]|nr:unnamed protein product [Closterium sp. Naga37s-1]
MTVIRAFLVFLCTFLVALHLPAVTADIGNPIFAATLGHGELGAPGGKALIAEDVRENADVRAIRYSIRALMDEREEEESPQARAVRVLAAGDAMLSAPLQGGGADADVAAEEPRRSKNGGKKGGRKGGKKGGKKGGTKGGNTRKDEGHTGKDDDNKRKDAENKRKDEVNKQKDEENKRKDAFNKQKDQENKRKDATWHAFTCLPAALLSPLTTPHHPSSPPPFSTPLTLHAPTPLALISQQGSAWQWLWGEFSCLPAALVSPLLLTNPPGSLPLTQPQGSAWQWMWGVFSCWPACHPPFIGSPHHTTPLSIPLLSPSSPPNPTAGQRRAVDVGRVQLPADVHLSARVGRAAASLKALGPLFHHHNQHPTCLSARVGRAAVSLKALGAHCYPTATTPTPLTRPSVCPSPCCLQECACGAGSSGLSEGPGAPLLCRGGFQSLS